MIDANQPPMDSDLADSIAMLEQILEVMPQDVIALKTLYNMYLKSGQLNHAFEYLGSLTTAICCNDDKEGATFVLEQLPAYEDEYPERSAELFRQIGTVTKKAEPTPKEKAKAKRRETDKEINEELALAWRLYEENQLSQEEYSSVLHDLTEVSAKDVNVPVSVLHVLNDRGFTQMNRIINYMSSRSGVPFITLSNFEIPKELKEELPLEIPTHEGAIPFAYFGEDLLLGVLNPFNNALVDKLESVCERRCHTFLVNPEDYDTALDRMRGEKK